MKICGISATNYVADLIIATANRSDFLKQNKAIAEITTNPNNNPPIAYKALILFC